jgi:hypothetical protein
VKFADDNRRAGRHKSDGVTQNFSWMAGVVQNHRDQRRARPYTIGLQRGCVCSDPLNEFDPTLLLATRSDQLIFQDLSDSSAANIAKLSEFPGGH